MEEFVKRGYTNVELAELNRCRQYLQATTLSDLASGDGKRITQWALTGTKSSSSPRYEWSYQARSPKRIWDKWETAIKLTFELQRGNYLPGNNRLGSWLSSAASTGFKYSPSEDTMYEERDSEWFQLSPVIRHRGRGSNQRYCRISNQVTNPPQDAGHAVCAVKNENHIASTGWSTIIREPSPEVSSLEEHLAKKCSESKWATSTFFCNDDGRYIATAIHNGEAIAVSDGSYKDGKAAAACIIEGAENQKHRITATSTSPGEDNIQDAYRAELTGIYTIVTLVEGICEYHCINRGSITIACDGIEALKKAMDQDTYFSCQSNQYDLISAIDAKIQKSPLQWTGRHVKGHQDDQIGPLDRWASLNVECDNLAKERRAADENNNGAIQHEIDGELWRLYHTFPADRLGRCRCRCRGIRIGRGR